MHIRVVQDGARKIDVHGMEHATSRHGETDERKAVHSFRRARGNAAPAVTLRLNALAGHSMPGTDLTPMAWRNLHVHGIAVDEFSVEVAVKCPQLP